MVVVVVERLLAARETLPPRGHTVVGQHEKTLHDFSLMQRPSSNPLPHAIVLLLPEKERARTCAAPASRSRSHPEQRTDTEQLQRRAYEKHLFSP